MDSALKQRLIGAVVLIALGIIFIPMLLDGPKPTAGSREVSLDIPAEPESPQSTRLLPVDATIDTPLPPVAVDATPRAPEIAQPGAEATTEVMPPPTATPAPSEVVAAPVVSTPTTAPVAVPPPSPAPRPPTPKPTPKPAPRIDGRYALQLGIYSNPENLGKIKAQLQALDVKVYEEAIQVDGKPAQRLRAGPYDSLASAESDKAKITLNAANLPLALINLASASTPAAADSAPRPGSRSMSGWAVQVGIFSSIENANKLKERLISGGFPAFVSEVSGEQGKSFRVRIGPELKRDNANALKDRVNRQFALQGFVVAHP